MEETAESINEQNDLITEVPEDINVIVDVQEIEKQVQKLVETVEEVHINNDTSETDEKLNELIDLIQENQELENEIKEQENNKLDLIESMLEEEELTEEEQQELEELLENEKDFQELQEEYFSNNLANNELLIDLQESNTEIIGLLETIKAQNDISNHADTVISMYGTMVFPAVVIVYCGYRFFRWFI